MGRKKSMIIVNIPLAIGWLMIYQADAIWKILVGCATLGLGNKSTENQSLIWNYLGKSVSSWFFNKQLQLTLISFLYLKQSFGVQRIAGGHVRRGNMRGIHSRHFNFTVKFQVLCSCPPRWILISVSTHITLLQHMLTFSDSGFLHITRKKKKKMTLGMFGPKSRLDFFCEILDFHWRSEFVPRVSPCWK